MDDINDERELPKMPQAGGRAHAFESSASMIWVILFLAYSSSTFVDEFGHGWPAAWTIVLVILPVALSGTPAILDKRPGAISMLISYLLYALVPAVLQLTKPQDYNSIISELIDLVTVLIIWLPIEFKLLSKDFSPTGSVSQWGFLTASLNIVNTFSVLRPFSKLDHAKELGYSFKFSPADILIGLVSGLLYCLFAVPLAKNIGFGKLKRPTGLKPAKELPILFGMYMNAVTEELLFRGLIQNMLEQRLGQQSLIALLLASMLFGAAHLKKSKMGFEFPNYRLAAISTVSGIFCGLTWRYSGKITTSAIPHAIGNFALLRLLLSKTYNL